MGLGNATRGRQVSGAPNPPVSPFRKGGMIWQWRSLPQSMLRTRDATLGKDSKGARFELMKARFSEIQGSFLSVNILAMAYKVNSEQALTPLDFIDHPVAAYSEL